MRLKSLLKRLFDKIVHDALPAALASILGGLLLTHFNIDRAPQPVTVKVTQASPEMMQLLRDEHGLMVDFVKEQAAGEKNRAATEQVDRNDTTEVSAAPSAEVLPTPPLPRPIRRRTRRTGDRGLSRLGRRQRGANRDLQDRRLQERGRP